MVSRVDSGPQPHTEKSGPVPVPVDGPYRRTQPSFHKRYKEVDLRYSNSGLYTTRRPWYARALSPPLVDKKQMSIYILQLEHPISLESYLRA